MYTGLRVKVFVKEEYREMIDGIMQDYEWLDYVQEFPFLNHFASMSRALFIPYGALSYMPDEWEEFIVPSLGRHWNNYKDATGWERAFNKDTGYWVFQCSLKNYEGEIELFLNEVLSVIIDEVEHVEYHYEEDDCGYLYKLVDGQLMLSGEKILYT